MAIVVCTGKDIKLFLHLHSHHTVKRINPNKPHGGNIRSHVFI